MDLFGMIAGLIWMGIVFSFAVLVYALSCLGRMRMFQKAGVPGWKAWIPLYSDYVLCAITMGRGWYFVFGLIPLLMPIMRAVYALEVTLSYGQGVLFGVLYFFLPQVAELVAGFGGARYCGSQDLERQLRSLVNGNFGADPGPYGGGVNHRADGWNGVNHAANDRTAANQTANGRSGVASGQKEQSAQAGQNSAEQSVVYEQKFNPKDGSDNSH